ncbi:MAG TPA: LysR substrate-binding domain-containing protein [Bradyrhizobium sp.]|nr:LysR substrate-binding domain-containing protein [Bradyrhizobium sp.]
MSVFVKVADLGSFAAAAKELRLSPTMIGKHMRHLEERLGSLLINRSTRRQSLTELGRNYLDHCRHLLEEAEAGDALAEEALRAPRGRLRVAAPIAFGSHSLAPTIVKFMKRYPEVSVELMLNDRMVDLVEEGIDVAVRVGTLADSTMMSRSLSPYRTVVCASPDYLAERGTPTHPKDLLDHDCLSFPDWTEGPRWSFLGPEGEVHVDIKSRLQINNGFGIRYAALAGAGIVMQRAELVAEDIAAGRLQALLSNYKTQSRPRHLV